MKELQNLIKRVEGEIAKMPTGELRNLLCDANIMLQQQALNPITPEVEEFVKWARLNHKLVLTIEDKWRTVDITAQNIEYTTSELFDWWNQNARK